MKSLILGGDKYNMNWVDGTVEWGSVKAPDGIAVKVETKRNGDIINERYTFTNVSEKDIFTTRYDIGIYTPFNDDYASSEECVTSRCHTHIRCGENVSYVMALRMGGDAPHLGLVLTEGSLCGYSTERDFDKMSNDRGDFILHPSPTHLLPEESFSVAWTIFPHEGKDDFRKKLSEYCPSYIDTYCENYIVFGGEHIHMEFTPNFDFSENDVEISRGGVPVAYKLSDGRITADEIPEVAGEYKYDITVKGVKTFCRVLAEPDIETLAKRRCEFIAANQQYKNPDSGLDGAYLIYDNEEGHIYYNWQYDYDGGRERLGMGLFIAKYLQRHNDAALNESLKKYITYVERELLDTDTGEVFNDYRRDNSYKRLYNYPWMSRFYLELYTLYKDRRYITTAYKILRYFYKEGGERFYAIEIPLTQILDVLEETGMNNERGELFEYFKRHCEYIIERGIVYPAHEVNFEQSISAPAAYLLFEMYKATHEEKYLAAAEKQLAALELFNGIQPDFHLYEVAIRHWDGYWFGKKKLYGDTFPHYWSALTANVYKAYAETAEKPEYLIKAKAAYRGVMSLIRPDGSASCAYVYPVTVNGIRAEYYDAYANDQDWGFYFMLRYLYEQD